MRETNPTGARRGRFLTVSALLFLASAAATIVWSRAMAGQMAMLWALSLCDGRQAPGVWAVITAWTPEPIPDEDGQSTTPAVGIGVALALTPTASAGSVRLVAPGPGQPVDARGTVFELADYLEQANNNAAPGA